MESIDFTKLEPFKAELIAFKIELLNNLVLHYKNSFLPDLKEYTGKSQTERLLEAEEKRDKFIHEATSGTPLKYLDFSKCEILNFLRSKAIEEREHAENYNQNTSIVIRALRKAVTYVNTLKEFEPKLEAYATKYLCKRTAISL